MHPIVPFLQSELQQAADPERAPSMQAYMKTEQFFYGISAPVRKAIFKQARLQFTIDTMDDYESVVRTLWAGESREEMYCALEVAVYFKKFRCDASMPLYEDLIHTSPSWDTLDWIAANLIGPVVKANRQHEKKLKEWRLSDNFWVRRTSLLAHLKHKESTNTELLEETIEILMEEKEFFIRKAIGWVLRDYSRTDGEWVEDFVERHAEGLSGLSKREALKWLNRQN